jgi:hypothetical protein
MPNARNALDRIPEFLREPVGEYAGLLRELAGENASALTLFGAVVSGAFDPGLHAVRSVLVLDQVDLEMLRRLAEHGRSLGKKHIAAPLIMTPAYIRESLDTFSLELLEIQQWHVAVFGRDHFADLAFEADHIRLQCERELKVLLIGLRQGLLAAAGRDQALRPLEIGATEALVRTLRGMLWLKDEKEPKLAADVVTAAESATNQKLDGIRTALDPAAQHGWRDFVRLYHDVATLEQLVNAW